MPIYVYEVILPDGKSGRRFEILQKISDPPLKKDPKTGHPVRRIFSPFSSPANRFDKTVKHFAKKDKLTAEIKRAKKAAGEKSRGHLPKR